MISVATQIQAILDALGIHLDETSFSNLLKHLRVDRLTFMQKTAIAFALSVLGTWIRSKLMEQNRVEAD